MRWIQVTLCVTLKSYTYFKPLDLSRSNDQKKTLINANILIRISLIIPYLLYFMSISKPKKSVIFDSLSTFLSLGILGTLLIQWLYLLILNCWGWDKNHGEILRSKAISVYV